MRVRMLVRMLVRHLVRNLVRNLVRDLVREVRKIRPRLWIFCDGGPRGRSRWARIPAVS